VDGYGRDAKGNGRASLNICNHFNHERALYSRDNFKANRAAALAEWRQLGVA